MYLFTNYVELIGKCHKRKLIFTLRCNEERIADEESLGNRAHNNIFNPMALRQEGVCIQSEEHILYLFLILNSLILLLFLNHAEFIL